MSQYDFDYSSPRYLMVRLVGLRKAQNELEEFRQREAWKRSRMEAFYSANGGNFKNIKSFADIMKFPWEKEQELPTFEEIQAMFPKYFA